jgi:phage-related holin
MKNLFFDEPWLFLKGALVFMIGPLNHQVSYLFMAMVVDLLFGVQVAFKKKDFKLTVLVRKFGIKVSMYLLWIVMFHAFDSIAGLPDTGRWSLIMILVGLEIASAIKNTARLGHTQLAEYLEALYLSLTKTKGGSANVKPTAKKRRTTKRSQDSDSDSV